MSLRVKPLPGRFLTALALAAAFLLGMLSGLSLALPGRSFRERIEEGFGPLLDRPQTRFAPGFREEVFRALPLGATESQVLKALGPPLDRRDCAYGTVCWDYSFPAAIDASFFPRVLRFDRSGRLSDRIMGFALGD